ncbi:MAG TPA: hypothetical protein PLF26_20290 [Blastocatellia bacterium]|nr:hypothetical protein [Blastocatellia bacterium]
MTMERGSARMMRIAVVAMLAMIVSLGMIGCGSEPAPPAKPHDVATGGETPPAEPKPPRKPIAIQTTEWPGIEARLMDCTPRGTTLLVEIELANTSAAPVNIENYSAQKAVIVDDVTKRPLEVLQVGGPPVATDGLTQTLAPNEVTTVTASFPLPHNAQLVTVDFPRIGKFEAIPLRKSAQTGGQAATNAKKDGDGKQAPGKHPNK